MKPWSVPYYYALYYYALGDGLMLADALIAATAIEHGLSLVSANVKHFRVVKGLELVAFEV